MNDTDRPSTRLSPRSALIVVDVQNDFAHPDGSLYVADGEGVVPAVNELVREAKAAGAPVFYTQDWHPPQTPHFQTGGGKWPVHCVAGTWGAELHADLEVDGRIVRKGTGGEDGYSGFTVEDPTTGERSSTGLAGLLHERGVRSVLVVGIAGDVCVRATALDSIREGFGTTVIEAAVRSVDLEPGDGARAMQELREAGATVS